MNYVTSSACFVDMLLWIMSLVATRLFCRCAPMNYVTSCYWTVKLFGDFNNISMLILQQSFITLCLQLGHLNPFTQMISLTPVHNIISLILVDLHNIMLWGLVTSYILMGLKAAVKIKQWLRSNPIIIIKLIVPVIKKRLTTSPLNFL